MSRFGDEYNPHGQDKQPFERQDEFERRRQEDAKEFNSPISEKMRQSQDQREFPEDD